jgi:ABC-type transport system involved in multi-copper enzyme maturation permease subunit
MTVSFPRLTLVELRKMVDTRAGFWLQLLVAVVTVAAVVLVCIVADADDATFQDLFTIAMTPGAILLPIVGILLVSSEWSQRTALITFTLVPRRMRVMSAKLAAGLVLGVIILAYSLVIAAVATLTTGAEWTLSAAIFGQICILVLTAMATGIAFGALFLSSAPAIVLSFVLPLGWAAIGSIRFLNDAAQWLDTTRTTEPLTDRTLSGEEWAQLGTSMLLWLAVPLAIGLWRIGRGEIRAA